MDKSKPSGLDRDRQVMGAQFPKPDTAPVDTNTESTVIPATAAEPKEDEIVEQCDPKNTPWHDITDEYNDDGQNAIEQGWITKDGGVTHKGYVYLHGAPKNSGTSRQIDVSTAQPMQTNSPRTMAEFDNRLISLEQAARKQLQVIISKYDYETSLRKAETTGYVLSVIGKRGGNNRPEIVYSAKGASPLDCYEKVLDHFSEEVATKHNS